MLDQINNYKKEIEKLKINNTKELEYFRVRFISKKSVINDLFKKFKTVPQKEKGKIGSEINTLKTIAKNKGIIPIIPLWEPPIKPPMESLFWESAIVPPPCPRCAVLCLKSGLLFCLLHL